MSTTDVIGTGDWGFHAPTIDRTPDAGFERILVLTPEHLRAVVADILPSPDWIGTDTETTGLDPREGAVIRLVQLAVRKQKKTYLCDMFAIKDHTPFSDLFASKMHILAMQNALFDFTFFLHQWNIFPQRIFDTMLADQLLKPFYKAPKDFGKPEKEYDPDEFVWTKQVHGLDDIVARRLHLTLNKEHQRSDWSGELTQDQLDYAATDAEILLPLAKDLSRHIEKEGMQDTMMVENRAVLVSAQMKLAGMKVARPEVEALQAEMLTKIADTETKLISYLPNPQLSLFEAATSVRLSSRSQLLTAVNRELNKARQRIIDEKIEITPSQQEMINAPIKLKSAKDEVLKEYRWLCPEMVRMYSEWKTLTKIYSSNLLNLIKAIDPVTERVYWDVFQLGQPTHRYTFTNPNMLNVPKSISYGPGVSNKESPRYSTRSFRSIFVAEPGHKLCIADYDSAQLRILINHSNDEGLITALNDGVDLHAKAGSEATGRVVTAADKEGRACGKGMNFCVLFTGAALRTKNFLLGMFDIDLPLEVVAKMVKAFKATKPGVVDYHKYQIAKVRKTKRIRVKGGRCVIVAPQADLYSESVNFPQVLVEQSGIKRAMGRIAREFLSLGMKAKIIFYCYDELICEAPDDEAEATCRIMERHMKESLDVYMGPNVYSAVEAKAVGSWGGK